MTDDLLFGMRNPEGGETGYCCVMGSAGIRTGLALYRGAEGLRFFLDAQDGFGPEDPEEARAAQKCLLAAFADRKELSAADLTVIRQLGLRFRGAREWPLFRSYEPGYLPWLPSAAEARFLNCALAQAVDMGERLRHEPHLLEAGPEDHLLVRIPRSARADTAWDEAWLPLAELEGPELPIPVDELRLERVRRFPVADETIWEVDTVPTSSVLQEGKGERPSLIRVSLIVDHGSGFVHGAQPHPAPRLREEFGGYLLDQMARLATVPGQILVARDETCELVEPLADALGIELSLEERLPALEPVRRDLLKRF